MPPRHPSISQMIKGHVHVKICISILYLVSRVYVCVVIIKHDKGCVKFLPVLLAGHKYIWTWPLIRFSQMNIADFNQTETDLLLCHHQIYTIDMLFFH